MSAIGSHLHVACRSLIGAGLRISMWMYRIMVLELRMNSNHKGSKLPFEVWLL